MTFFLEGAGGIRDLERCARIPPAETASVPAPRRQKLHGIVPEGAGDRSPHSKAGRPPGLWDRNPPWRLGLRFRRAIATPTALIVRRVPFALPHSAIIGVTSCPDSPGTGLRRNARNGFSGGTRWDGSCTSGISAST